jgi:hypothetical protein
MISGGSRMKVRRNLLAAVAATGMCCPLTVRAGVYDDALYYWASWEVSMEAFCSYYRDDLGLRTPAYDNCIVEQRNAERDNAYYGTNNLNPTNYWQLVTYQYYYMLLYDNPDGYYVPPGSS